MKPRVLILTDWYIPGYRAGGPIQSIKNLVEQTCDEVEYTIVTGDRDLLESESYPDVKFDQSMRFETHTRLYTSAPNRSKIIQQLLLADEFDKVYMNSFFSVEFTIRPLLTMRRIGKLQKVVLAPRGMLGAGALAIKPIKKKIFLSLFKLLGIDSSIRIHSTDISETRDIRRALPNGKNVYEISNIPACVVAEPRIRTSDQLSLIFASRVSPKKNLLFGLEMLDKADTSAEIEVYGLVDDPEYGKACQQFSSDRVRVNFNGPVSPSVLSKAFQKSDFFILPTQNENFGHSIIEALSYGLPVLISDQCPWTDVEQFGAGWVISLDDRSGWIRAFEKAARLTPSEYQEMSKQAIAYVHHKINFDDIREKYLTLFRDKN